MIKRKVAIGIICILTIMLVGCNRNIEEEVTTTINEVFETSTSGISETTESLVEPLVEEKEETTTNDVILIKDTNKVVIDNKIEVEILETGKKEKITYKDDSITMSGTDELIYAKIKIVNLSGEKIKLSESINAHLYYKNSQYSNQTSINIMGDEKFVDISNSNEEIELESKEIVEGYIIPYSNENDDELSIVELNIDGKDYWYKVK